MLSDNQVQFISGHSKARSSVQSAAVMYQEGDADIAMMPLFRSLEEDLCFGSSAFTTDHNRGFKP